MARYFFHTQTSTRYTDEEGSEFGTPVAARDEAIELCAELVKGAPDRFWGSRPWTVTVTDASGLILWELSVDGVAAPAAANLEDI